MASRVGVVGLGFFGKILLNILRETPGVEVAAVHDRFPGKENEIDLAGARFYASLEEMYKQADLDAVVIAEIPAHHLRATELAAQAGIHVFCEKPMANSVADCDKMIDACSRHHVKLMIGFKHRFAKAMSQVKRDLPKLGRPLWAMYTYPLWKVDDSGWKFDENGTKGIVVENMVHAFDIMRYFFGDMTQSICRREPLRLQHHIAGFGDPGGPVREWRHWRHRRWMHLRAARDARIPGYAL